MQDQPLPRNEAAERGLICCVLLWPEEVLPAVVDRLGPSLDAFTDTDDKGIYWATQQLHSRGAEVDVVSVISEICKVKGEDNFQYWSHVVRSKYKELPTATNYETYLETVADCSMRRQLITKLDSPVMGLYDQETDFEDLKSDIVAAVSMCSSSNDEPETSILEETRTLNNEIRQGGLTTGYTKLDNHISCIYPSDFWVISARSGEGKSMFIGPMMMHQAESGCPVGVIHLEMERMEYVWRMVGSKLKMDSNEVRKKADSDPVVIAEIERVQSLPIIYANNLVMNTLNIARWAKKAVREHGIKVLYIDHGLLIEPEYDDEVKATKKSANDLKKLKKELGIPVVLLWQFNKGAEQTFENEEGKQEYVPPKRGHLNSSGAVAQAATRILLLSLKRGTSPEFKLTEELKKREDKPLKLKVNVDKNRFGAEPLLTMDMYPKWGYIDGSRVSDEIVEKLQES